jgi:hypothetical protein
VRAGLLGHVARRRLLRQGVQRVLLQLRLPRLRQRDGGEGEGREGEAQHEGERGAHTPLSLPPPSQFPPLTPPPPNPPPPEPEQEREGDVREGLPRHVGRGQGVRQPLQQGGVRLGLRGLRDLEGVPDGEGGGTRGCSGGTPSGSRTGRCTRT